MQDIRVELTKHPKQKPDQNHLGFGQYFTDHMFIMDYTEGVGWHDARIVPYAPIELDPAAMVFHYAQEVFEGMKAYLAPDRRILLFRPEKNMERLNNSNERVCIPKIDPDFCIHALEELLKIDRDWIPSAPDTSLYIRPFIFATDPYVGVRVGNQYKFIIILSPVGAYYPEGLNPVKIYVEPTYVRAVRGGLGQAKTGANYAASLKAQQEAKQVHYTQVLWLDGVERKYIEEVGTMNVFFKIGDTIVTPVLQGSILPGITRRSVIELLNSWNVPVEERLISVEELFAAHEKGELKEAFGSGTAAVISPIGELRWGDRCAVMNNGEIGAMSQKLYDELTGIQWGRRPDPFGWTHEVK